MGWQDSSLLIPNHSAENWQKHEPTSGFWVCLFFKNTQAQVLEGEWTFWWLSSCLEPTYLNGTLGKRPVHIVADNEAAI